MTKFNRWLAISALDLNAGCLPPLLSTVERSLDRKARDHWPVTRHAATSGP
jgi:hypothetical protein